MSKGLTCRVDGSSPGKMLNVLLLWFVYTMWVVACFIAFTLCVANLIRQALIGVEGEIEESLPHFQELILNLRFVALMFSMAIS